MITTELIRLAAIASREVFVRSGRKLHAEQQAHDDAATAMRRAAIMNLLASDEGLCEMLAGHIILVQETDDNG